MCIYTFFYSFLLQSGDFIIYPFYILIVSLKIKAKPSLYVIPN